MKDAQQLGLLGTPYNTDAHYQQQLRTLFNRYRYRLDTNFAKIDRIRHQGLEQFKSRVLSLTRYGYTLGDWIKMKRLEDSKMLEQFLG
jgi:hypothetical protein